MKNLPSAVRIRCALLTALLLLPAGALISFAEGEEQPASFLTVLGNNIWYILLVIAFGAGILLVSKWSRRINESDEKFKEEYDKYQAEHPEEAEDGPSDSPVEGQTEEETDKTKEE